ncbi:uncharacterized protein [Periplaneta americana]|uniref:uncharacterized protein isoform X1 n=1 Tax=Periplaneta americana TaxID=6978 RepID=UPI0037E9B0CD
MSRGRGFSGRGSSFRGRGDGSWNDGGSRGRGFSGPSRGRFNWYKEHSSSFDSRSRYQSGGVSSSGERYSSRGRGDDSSYRRYSRMDGPGYSSRDHSHHRSPESQRKRMRTDHGYVQASSSRRSQEGSYGGGSDYSNRYGYSEEKGGYGDERGRGYREERRSASSFRDRSREDYPHRKAEQLDSSMPPPSSAPRHLSSPRGSFRGRISGRGTRGMSRMIFTRRADNLLIRKKSLMDSSYTFRKRMLAARSQAENLRRLKLQRLRRIREAALSAKKEGGDKDGSKATEDISDEEEKEGNWDEDLEKVDGDDDEEEEDDDELEEGETPDKKEKTKKEKKKEPKPSGKDEEREEGEEVDDDEDDDDDAGSLSGSPSKKSDMKNDGGVHVTIKQDSDARAVSEEGRKRLPRSMITGKHFIPLTCPHCYVRCITFTEYTLHLYTSKHTNTMRKQSLRLKQTLARMRLSQRQKQRILEESEEVHGSLASRSNFCPICKLHYRQLKSKHQASESHRAIKKFLMPYCRVCRIGFTSPMLYENHICSLDHLKRKARLEERMMHMHRDRDRDDDDGSGMDDKELNMDNFMILDSVGTVDDTGDEGDDDGKPKSDKDKKEGEEKKKEINLGSEYIKKVEVYYCELCRLYLPRLDQPERALSIHCRTRNHLQRYVRYRDDRALRSKAEKIHHRKEIAKENAAKEAEAKKNSEAKKDEDEKKDDEANGANEKDTSGKGSANAVSTETGGKKNNAEGTTKSNQDSGGHDTSTETTADGGAEGDGDLDQDLESGMDDKLWADVDKDLGELLREVEPGNKSSDEDDDSRKEGGRYDRFRYSEKGNATVADPTSEGDTVKTVAEADETVTKSDAGKGTKEAINGKPPGEDKNETVNDDDAAATASN